MAIILSLCAVLLAIASCPLALSRASSFHSLQQMDEQCEKYTNEIIEPMLEYFAQMYDQKIAKLEKNERIEKERIIIHDKVIRLEERIKCKEEKERIGKKLEYLVDQISNLTAIIQSTVNEVSDLKEINNNISIQNSELIRTVEILSSQLSKQQSKLAEYFNFIKHIPNSCEVMKNYSGTLTTKLSDLSPFNVSCDSKLAGSGWTVIQRRINGTVDFKRNWSDYKEGFGNIDGEFFIGLERLHLMTTVERYELYIHLVDQANEVRFARYDNFVVESEKTKYELSSVGNYSGTAGDSLSLHRGYKFSTFDNDNDIWSGDCANAVKGAWWFSYCADSNLNGYNFKCALKKSHSFGQSGCIYWNGWHGRSYSLKHVQMMIRPWRLK